jgi:hypothetical protein
MLAIAQALRGGQTGIAFKFSFWTDIAFLTGAVVFTPTIATPQAVKTARHGGVFVRY